MKWGKWYNNGNRFSARAEYTMVDTYPNNFSLWVEVRDEYTGTIYKRRGLGKYIGNFSPIWISFMGKKMQLTELLRLRTPL
jgi:hypothetical protein